MFDFDLIEAILSIVIIDLVLSGDNALVIAMATRSLPPAERRRAILLGAGGAIALRVICTALVAVLLGIPLLQAGGGLLLLWIAYKLVRRRKQEHTAREGSTLGEAVRTIMLADAVMSLDNMLAVGGAAHGNIALLLFGLALSMPIIIFASGLIVALLNRLPWLLYVGAAILVYTAARLLLEDPLLRPHYPHTAVFTWGATLLMLVGVVGLAYWRNRRQSAASPEVEREETVDTPAAPMDQPDPAPTAPADQPDPAPVEPKTLDSGQHSEQEAPRSDARYARRAP